MNVEQRAPALNRQSLIFWWLIPVLLLSFALGAAGLDADPMWADEYHSIYDAGGSIYGPKSPADIWTGIAQRNPWHAPGFFVILAGWGALVGWQPPALRALSLLLGMLVIAWTYRLGRDSVSPRAGIFAAALMGTAALFTHYLHEMRMYTLLLALTLFTVWLYLRLIRPGCQPKWGGWLGLLVGAVGLLYTHFFGALPLAAVGLYHLLFVRKDAKWWRVVALLALAGVLFLPWADVLRAGIRETQQDTELRAEALDALASFNRFIELASNDYLLPPAALLGAAILAVMAAARPGKAAQGIRRMGFFGLLLLCLILVTNAVLLLMTAERARYLLLPLPFLAVVMAAGLIHLGFIHRAGRWLALALLLAWMGTGILASLNRDITDEVDGSGYIFPLHRVTRALAGQLQANDFLLSFLPSSGNPSRSYERMAPVYFDGLPVTYQFEQVPTRVDEIEYKIDAARESISERQHFWLAYMPDHDPAELAALEGALREQHSLCYAALNEPDLLLGLYTRSPVCCQPQATSRPPIAIYGDSIAISAIQAPPEADGAALPVLMSWSLDADVPADTYSVALHVIDSAGELVAQADYGLRALAFSCYDQVISLETLPPGMYTLRVGVYAWQTGQRLTGTLTDTGEQADMLPLATFRIEL